MNICLEASDLKEIGERMTAEFGRRIASIPPDLCTPFHTEARDLETQLLTMYQMVVTIIRKMEDLDQVAKLWQSLVKLCDQALLSLNGLVKQHPFCGANVYYDRVSDLRNKCQRLQEMHS